MKSYTIKNEGTCSLEIETKCCNELIVNKNLYEELRKTKTLIDDHIHEWDKYKKKLNEYEYIYTSNNHYKNICKINPVSRSFFKMVEIIHDFNIDIHGNIACIAEAPGGFVESFLYHNKNNTISTIHGITLLSKDKKIPYWNPQLCKSPLLTIYSGKDKTGDIYNFSNSLDFIKKVGRHSCDIVTSDGGFDYSTDFNNQEKSSYKLILNEILITLNIQKKGGIFICKLFDLFYESTIKLLYILYLSYDKISFIKPKTSRPSNSEKYIVCQGYRGFNKDISNLLCKYKETDFLPIQLSDFFLDKITIFNQYFINEQIKCIQLIISNIKRKGYTRNINKQFIKNAVQWCETYNMPINTKCIYLHRTFG